MQAEAAKRVSHQSINAARGPTDAYRAPLCLLLLNDVAIPITAAIANPVLWPAFPQRLFQYFGQGTSPANQYNYPMNASLDPT